MRRAALLAVVIAVSSSQAVAETSAAETAMTAAADLRAAIVALDAAEGSRNRVAALTETIGAYETGLVALRDGLRRAAIREATIRADFDARRDRIGQLLGVMAGMEQSPGPLVLIHPSGPEGSARAGMILASVTPALQAEAETLRGDLTELALLRELQESAAGILKDGLREVQEARTALSQAVSDRTDLPQRFLEDPEELRQLVESADTLEGFAGGLAALETDIGPPMEDFASARGGLSLPVLGTLLRRAGEADAAGIRRPGMVIATRPAALVRAPWPATIRYRGPLLDYGNVMILEPAKGYLMVLAGLGVVYGETSDVLEKGAPVGLMGGTEPGGDAFLADAEEGGGAGQTETLYVELREGAEPVDPSGWFIETREN